MAPRAGPITSPSPEDIADHLRHSDPVLGEIVRHLGPIALPDDRGGFPSLVRAIVFQQISGAAGTSILRKVRRAHGGRSFPTPEWFLRVPATTLASAGLSPQKRRYVVDLARHVRSGRLDFARLRRASDDEVVDALTDVTGIGRWTAQMYLIFSLHRPDVLPTGDLGIRKAVGRAWGFRTLPAERTVERIGRRWAPYRSYASYYLWQSLTGPAPTDRGRDAGAERVV